MVGKPIGSVERVHEVLRFAQERLGPFSEQVLRAPELQARALAMLRGGRTVEDAVLAIVFREARRSRDRRLADEFFAHLLGEIFRVGRSLLNPGLRDLMETGELVNSVLKDLWRDLERVEFRTRGQFLAFLLRKMRWKATTHVRAANREKRGGGRRPVGAAEALKMADPGPSPAVEVESRDQEQRMSVLLHHFAAGERKMLLMHLRGDGLARIAEEFATTPKGAQSQIRALLMRVRSML